MFCITGFTFPDRQWRAPITFTRQIPINNIFKEITEASCTDVFRYPVDFFIVFNKFIPHFCHGDKPAGTGIIKQSCITAPAERIIVLKIFTEKQQATLIKILNELRVSLLDKNTGEFTSFRCKLAFQIYQLDMRQIIFAPETGIIFTKGWRDMHNSSSVIEVYIRICNNIKGALLVLDQLIGVVKKRSIAFIQQFTSGHGTDNSGVFTENFFNQSSCQVIAAGSGIMLGAACDFNQSIFFVFVHAECHVRRQSPGRRRPDSKVGIIFTLYRHAHIYRSLGNIFVALSHFMTGEGCTTTRAIWHNTVPFIDKAFFPDFL